MLQKGLEQGLGREVEVINTGVSGLRAEHHWSRWITCEPIGLIR
jgi:hypothetical protein